MRHTRVFKYWLFVKYSDKDRAVFLHDYEQQEEAIAQADFQKRQHVIMRKAHNYVFGPRIYLVRIGRRTIYRAALD
jgi:hypothetical protein